MANASIAKAKVRKMESALISGPSLIRGYTFAIGSAPLGSSTSYEMSSSENKFVSDTEGKLVSAFVAAPPPH